MHTPTDERAIYFPPHLELQYDKEGNGSPTCVRLTKMAIFQFFSIRNLLNMESICRTIDYCSFNSDLSYGRGILLHRHITWIFLMDEVSERLPIYELHVTVGKIYLQNLKGITRNEPIEDMMQFKGKCSDELFQTALNVQRIFARI